MLSYLKKVNQLTKSVCKVLKCSNNFKQTKHLYALGQNQNVSLPKELHTNAICLGLNSKGRAQMLKVFKERADEMKEKGLWIEDRRADFIEWNYEAEIYALGKRLNEEFDEDLIREALIDSSYIHQELKKLKELKMDENFSLKSNDELSTAGKALIENFLPKYLRAAWPSLPEEGIQATCEYLMSDSSLGRIGQSLGLKDLIMIRDYPPSPTAFAKSFAAMVSALNVSSDLENTYKFIQDFVIAQLVGRDLWDFWDVDDPYTMLGNIFKRNQRGDIEPRIIGDLGKNTVESVYHIGIYCNKEYIGAGYGDTIDSGVQVASYNCLSKLFGQSLDRTPLPFYSASEMILKTDQNESIQEWILKDTETPNRS